VNLRHLFAELKRRNVYKVAVAVFLKQPEAAFAVIYRSLVSANGLDPVGIWVPPLRPLFRDRRFAEMLRALKMPDYWRARGSASGSNRAEATLRRLAAHTSSALEQR
jgi:hypothetical protein